MKIRLLIKGDAIQCGENDFYNPCRTIDIDVTDNLIDIEHEHIIGVEVKPQEIDIEECPDKSCIHKYCIHYEDGCKGLYGCPCVYYKTESDK